MKTPFTYGSICSGIESASVAWHPLGWRAQFFSEIEKQPSAVLAHRFPEVKNYGDFTKIPASAGPIDLLVGGTPWQDFSIAGLRAGLDGERSSLALEFFRLARRLRPRWLVWENVTGVLSSYSGPQPPSDLAAGQRWEADETSDFAAILSGFLECGYGFAYRVLDAQFIRVDGFPRAVPQRRERVIVIGYFGDWRRAAAVLFEPESMSGNPAPRRKTGQDVAGTLGGSSQSGGFRTTDLDNNGAYIPELMNAITSKLAKGSSGPAGDVHHHLIASQVAGPLTANANEGDGGSRQPGMNAEGAAAGHLIAFSANDYGNGAADDVSPTLRAMGASSAHQNDGQHMAIAFQPCIAQPGHNSASGWRVRRLTPLECERLQGFPDNWTLVPYAGRMMADGPRYKMLGNSMAVNKMRWIGQRIAMVESLGGA